MKIFIKSKTYLLGVFLFGMLSCTTTPVVQKMDNVTEAKKIYDLQKKYIIALKEKDYKIIYSLQHPLYKALVTEEDFIIEEGRILLNMSRIDKATNVPEQFHYTPPIPFDLVEYEIENLFIDKEMKYSKIVSVISKDMSPGLPSKGPLIIKHKIEDYWEKVDDDWYILFKRMDNPTSHISGNSTGLSDKERQLLFPEEFGEYSEIATQLLN